ncbi:glycoside hydrolase superfamily, partial [Globomyces pollinis-pini]
VGVQLFQWPFNDIARECTDFLGPNGYGWVQTSPVSAHVRDGFDGEKFPWYLAYQPMAYKIGNRLGTEEEFSQMVKTCRAAGVEVVVDVVLNHFAYV